MTVIDTSAVVDYLLGVGVGDEVEALLRDGDELAAPDVLVFEAVAVLRRHTLVGELEPRRARAAIEDLAELPVELFPSMPLCARAFELRENLTAADALFAALAEELTEPIATKDRAMARAIVEHCDASVLPLG